MQNMLRGGHPRPAGDAMRVSRQLHVVWGYSTPVPGCITLPRNGQHRAVSAGPMCSAHTMNMVPLFPTCSLRACTDGAASDTAIPPHPAPAAGARAPSATRTTSASSAGSTRRATCAARSAISSTRAPSRCRPLPRPPPTALAARCSAPCWRCAWRESWGTRGTGGAARESCKLLCLVGGH